MEEDVAECELVVEEKCQEDATGTGTSRDIKCAEMPTKKCSLKSQPVDKIIPDTSCEKIGVELCGPAGCGYYEGAEECREEEETVVFDKPVEVCTVEPKKNCKFLTKLVPLLKENESCIDVPMEVCQKVKRNPKKVSHPVIKQWCYEVEEKDETLQTVQNGYN